MEGMKSLDHQHPDTCALCGEPADLLYLHPKCHLHSPVWVKVVGDVAMLECAECRADVGALKLATEGHDGGLHRHTHFSPTPGELGLIAGCHLYEIRHADFEQELAGSTKTCTDCYRQLCARIETIRGLMGDVAFTEATAWVEEEWQRKRADIQFFRQCEKCGNCEIDKRRGEECPICGSKAATETVAS